jgi:hypothetical protein
MSNGITPTSKLSVYPPRVYARCIGKASEDDEEVEERQIIP